MRKVVVNSTPLISLSIINCLNILKDIYGQVYVPYGVYEEVCLEGKNKIGSNIYDSDFIIIEQVKNQEAKKFFQANLHKGEVETMILADEIKADLCIIDDLDARKYAKYLGLNVTGTLGVLLKAKEKGVINNVKELMDKLILNDIYIGEVLYNQVLKISNEY